MTRYVTLSEYEAEIQQQEGVVVTIRRDRPNIPSLVESYSDKYVKVLTDDQTLRILAKRIKTVYPGIMFHMVMGDGRAAFTPATKLKTIRDSYTRNKELKNHEGRLVSNFSLSKAGAKRTI